MNEVLTYVWNVSIINCTSRKYLGTTGKNIFFLLLLRNNRIIYVRSGITDANLVLHFNVLTSLHYYENCFDNIEISFKFSASKFLFEFIPLNNLKAQRLEFYPQISFQM